MTESGQLGPEPHDGSGERDYGDLLDPADGAQQPDEALDAILSEVVPCAPRDTLRSAPPGSRWTAGSSSARRRRASAAR